MCSPLEQLPVKSPGLTARCHDNTIDKGGNTQASLTFRAHDYLVEILAQIWAVYSTAVQTCGPLCSYQGLVKLEVEETRTVQTASLKDFEHLLQVQRGGYCTQASP